MRSEPHRLPPPLKLAGLERTTSPQPRNGARGLTDSVVIKLLARSRPSLLDRALGQNDASQSGRCDRRDNSIQQQIKDLPQ